MLLPIHQLRRHVEQVDGRDNVAYLHPRCRITTLNEAASLWPGPRDDFQKTKYTCATRSIRMERLFESEASSNLPAYFDGLDGI